METKKLRFIIIYNPIKNRCREPNLGFVKSNRSLTVYGSFCFLNSPRTRVRCQKCYKSLRAILL